MSINIETWYGPIIAIGAAFGVLAHYFRGMRAQDDRINSGFKEQDVKITDLQIKINTMETWVNIWKNIMEKELPKVLIKPHRPEIDVYMRKMRDHGLNSFTEEEMEDFINKMRLVISGKVPDSHLDDDALKLGYTFVIGNVVTHLEMQRLKQNSQHNRKYGLGVFG